MKVRQALWRQGRWDKPLPSDLDSKRTVCFIFFGPEVELEEPRRELAQSFPSSHRVGCSGAGEISNAELLDDTLVLTVVQFESSEIHSFCEKVSGPQDSFEAGKRLASAVDPKDLKALYIVSEGLAVNGTELARGIYSVLPTSTLIAGGLAADGTKFQKTTILYNDSLSSGQVVAVAFYGEDLVIGMQANAGWLPFGPVRKITSSQGNVLHTLDGSPALKLYKEFLGPSSSKLPASALMFPLLLGPKNEALSRNTVRTILGIDEEKQSMIFAGDMPEGEFVRFMRVNARSLVEAAGECAGSCRQNMVPDTPALSLMVSCVGQRLVLGITTDEEIEAVFHELPPGSVQGGFYSYGELAPGNQGHCDLHNQTVTLTWIQERPSDARASDSMTRDRDEFTRKNP